MLAKYTEDFLNEIYKPGMDVKYADETDLYLELEKARGLSKQIKREHIKHLEISQLLQGDFGVKEITKYIKDKETNRQCKKFGYSFEIVNNSGFKREIKLIFVDYLGFTRSTYNKYAERVFMILYLLRNTSDHCSQTLNIYCYMTPFKKLLPESRSVVLSSAHINTGVTYQCIKNNDICVYRHEEWFKVLIHELFHAHGVDMGITFTPKHFYINSTVHIGEAYVEFWAVYLNSVIAAYYLAKRDNILQNTTYLFSEYLAKFIRAERIFSLIQVNKILRHNNVKYSDLFVSKNRYRENTNVFAYFILKSILLFNYYNFMVKTMKHNNNNYTVINEKYIEQFIEKYSKNREYRKYLKRLNVNYMTNSLRLTIIEII
jgi:hypothetical protein